MMVRVVLRLAKLTCQWMYQMYSGRDSWKEQLPNLLACLRNGRGCSWWRLYKCMYLQILVKRSSLRPPIFMERVDSQDKATLTCQLQQTTPSKFWETHANEFTVDLVADQWIRNHCHLWKACGIEFVYTAHMFGPQTFYYWSMFFKWNDLSYQRQFSTCCYSCFPFAFLLAFGAALLALHAALLEWTWKTGGMYNKLKCSRESTQMQSACWRRFSFSQNETAHWVEINKTVAITSAPGHQICSVSHGDSQASWKHIAKHSYACIRGTATWSWEQQQILSEDCRDPTVRQHGQRSCYHVATSILASPMGQRNRRPLIGGCLGGGAPAMN